MGLKDRIAALLRPGARRRTSGGARPPGTRQRTAATASSGGGGATHDASVGSVVIEYSPLLDGDPDPGEVVWTWVPYEDDPQQGKDRPVVVIGRQGGHLAGVSLTSKDHDRPDCVPVGAGAWDRSGRPSYAKIDRILSIDPAAVRREGAVLDKPRFDALVDATARYHGARFHRR